MNFLLPESIKYVLNTLNSAGFQAYIVGGCVRDILLGITPNDYDITTSAKPWQVENLFPNVIKTGIRHGTVTVIYKDNPIEVTTFRTEGSYNDSRRPDNVDFVNDVKLDLSRRDFTVNAMCYSEKSGLVDCFGGTADINRKILRAVGEPEKRFCEDALRILRLFRFASTLEFQIEQETLKAAIKCSHLLSKVSAERIAVELKKAVLGNNITILNELLKTSALENYGLNRSNFESISRLSKKENLRLFAFLNLSSSQITDSAKKLKMSNAFCNYCADMKDFLSADFSGDISYLLKTCLARFGIDTVLQGLEYKEIIENKNCNSEKLEIARIIDSNEPYALSHLAVSGDDIAKLQIKGEKIGPVLNMLLDRVRKEPRLNSKETLLKIAQENK